MPKFKQERMSTPLTETAIQKIRKLIQSVGTDLAGIVSDQEGQMSFNDCRCMLIKLRQAEAICAGMNVEDSQQGVEVLKEWSGVGQS